MFDEWRAENERFRARLEELKAEIAKYKIQFSDSLPSEGGE